jgi:hypothetical protein
MGTQGVTSWRTSSYTGNGGGTCVEVGHAEGQIAIRDTKNHGAGPVLTVPAAAWKSFTETLR